MNKSKYTMIDFYQGKMGYIKHYFFANKKTSRIDNHT